MGATQQVISVVHLEAAHKGAATVSVHVWHHRIPRRLYFSIFFLADARIFVTDQCGFAQKIHILRRVRSSLHDIEHSLAGKARYHKIL